MGQNLYQTGQFAQLAGVSIRTLRYYDKEDFLKPTQYTNSGQRLYSDQDLIQLQQILTLKFLGFQLAQIKQLLQVQPTSIKESLNIQKQMLIEKRNHLDSIIEAINQVQIYNDNLPDWNFLTKLIKVIQMEKKDPNWWKKYYTEEQVEKLEDKLKTYSAEDHQRDAKRWQDLINEFKQSVGKDPASDEVQALAKRQEDLILEFTQGDPGIYDNMQKAYKNSEYPSPYTKEEEEFVKQAGIIYKQNKGIK